MSGLLSGLEQFGLGELSKRDVFEDVNGEKKSSTKDNKGTKEVKEKTEEEYLFDKSYTCPCCDREFKTKAVRTGKAKLIGTDMDLHPKYQGVDPLKYDAVVCPNCGYAALTRYFDKLLFAQSKLIKEQISPKFTKLPETGAFFSYEDALLRHRLALVSAMVKKSKISERAYICLKTAWILRSKAEQETNPEEKKELAAQELEFLTTAYDGFVEAIQKEMFPICGMDESTLNCVLCELGRRIGRFEEAYRLVGRILTSRSSSERIKNHARMIKEKIQEEYQPSGMTE